MFRRFRSLRLFAFSLVALVVVIGAEASQVVAESFLAAEEDRMLEMVNDHRARHGLEPLESNDALRWVARRHTRRMAARRDIFHNPDLGAQVDEAVPDWRMLGENVGMGPSLEAVQKAFLDSDAHRANIEQGRFDTVGIGGVAGPEGRRYFTQDLAARDGAATPPPPSPTPLPATPAPPAPATAPPPPTPVVTPVPAAPEAPAPAGTSPPPAEPAVASASEPDDRPRPDEGRTGFFELLLGLLTRFVEKLGFG